MMRRVLRRLVNEIGSTSLQQTVESYVPGLRGAGPVPVVVNGQSFEVEPGCTVLEACLQHDIDIEHSCGGDATCGTCRVTVRKGRRGMSKVDNKEKGPLHAFKEHDDDRLACQARITGPVEIDVPDDWRSL